MKNPFLKQAHELSRKSDLWDNLTVAREWVDKCYAPAELTVDTRHSYGSSSRGYVEGMRFVSEGLRHHIPTKEALLAEIDRQLAELTK